MIDPVLLRENPELVKRSQEARGHSSETVDAALDADRERRAAITAFEELRAAQNAHGKRVAQAPKDEKAALVAEAKELSAQVKQAQQRVTLAEEAAEAALSRIENIVIDGVPAGGEADFVTLRTHGEPRTFDFGLVGLPGGLMWSPDVIDEPARRFAVEVPPDQVREFRVFVKAEPGALDEVPKPFAFRTFEMGGRESSETQAVFEAPQ